MEAVAGAQVAANERLALLRAGGSDPAHGGMAGRRRGARVSEQLRTSFEFDRVNGGAPRPETFTREILPGLMAISTRAMASATGLSHPYCSMIKRGVYVPAARQWAALRELADGTKGSGGVDA